MKTAMSWGVMVQSSSPSSATTADVSFMLVRIFFKDSLRQALFAVYFLPRNSGDCSSSRKQILQTQKVVHSAREKAIGFRRSDLIWFPPREKYSVLMLNFPTPGKIPIASEERRSFPRGLWLWSESPTDAFVFVCSFHRFCSTPRAQMKKLFQTFQARSISVEQSRGSTREGTKSGLNLPCSLG